MCGIVGYVGCDNALPHLLNGLKRLEYRGYDSSGVIVGNKNVFSMYKKAGKLKVLTDSLPKDVEGNYGIAHTRWATHGTVCDKNAHPLYSSDKSIAIVHNGIVENYEELRRALVAEGYTFISDTDSEVLAVLIQKYYSENLLNSVERALQDVLGTYALAVVSVRESDTVVVAKRGSPLVIGLGNNAYTAASDVMALGDSNRVIYLMDGDVVELKPSGLRFFSGNDYSSRVENVSALSAASDKGDFSTYMEKEITEQASCVKRALAGRLDMDNATARLTGFGDEFLSARRVGSFSAGTSYYASMVGSYLMEKYARVPSTYDVSSELRYRNPIVEKGDAYIAVSQSGETADTISAMRELQRKGGSVYGICNVVSSTIARESVGGAFIHAGSEIAVASTKAFTNTLTVYYLLALKMARYRDMEREDAIRYIAGLEEIPRHIEEVLKQKDLIAQVAKKYCNAHDVLYMARGILYPIALEGALKLKEVSYIHAEGYAAGELKHGPIALIKSDVPSVFLVDDSPLRPKVISNIKEVKARGGTVIAIAVADDDEVSALADDFIAVPKASNSDFYAIPMAVVEQLLAYYCARELGRDVDQPRNLAKSVTVE